MKLPLLLILVALLCCSGASANRPAPDQPGDTQPWTYRYSAPPVTAQLVRRLTVLQRTVKRQRRVIVGLHRTLLHRETTADAINLACTVYGYCSTLWRKARCESHLYTYARNPSGASGLFQFLPSTWRSTPFAGFSIFDPFANALAAGWMHVRGRGDEWVCR